MSSPFSPKWTPVKSWARVVKSTLITVTDEVELQDATQGVVKFVGFICDKGETPCYGIQMARTKGKGGKAEGAHLGTRYFRCASRTRGEFVKRSRIARFNVSAKWMPRIFLNDKVCVTVSGWKCVGDVKYIGIPDKKDTVYFGILLNTPKGDCDGAFNGQRYFQTEERSAVFVDLSSDIEKIGLTKTVTVDSPRRRRKTWGEIQSKRPSPRRKHKAQSKRGRTKSSESPHKLTGGSKMSSPKLTSRQSPSPFYSPRSLTSMPASSFSPLRLLDSSATEEVGDDASATPVGDSDIVLDGDFNHDFTAATVQLETFHEDGSTDGSSMVIKAPPKDGRSPVRRSPVLSFSPPIDLGAMGGFSALAARRCAKSTSVGVAVTHSGSPPPSTGLVVRRTTRMSRSKTVPDFGHKCVAVKMEQGHFERVDKTNSVTMRLRLALNARSGIEVEIPRDFTFDLLLKSLNTEFGALLSSRNFWIEYKCHAKGSIVKLDASTLYLLRANEPDFLEGGDLSLRFEVSSPKTVKAAMLLREGRHSEALALLREDLEEGKHEFDTLLTAAKCAMVSLDFAQAEQYLDDALLHDTDTSEAFLVFAQVLEATGRREQAKEYYQLAQKITKAPKVIVDMALLRLKLVESGTFASSTFEKRIESDVHLSASDERSMELAQIETNLAHAFSQESGGVSPKRGGGAEASDEIMVAKIGVLKKVVSSTAMDLFGAHNITPLTEIDDDSLKLSTMVEKVRHCTVLCCFELADESSDEMQRICNKTQMLNELVDTLPSVDWTDPRSDELLAASVKMLRRNMFAPVSSAAAARGSAEKDGYDSDDSDFFGMDGDEGYDQLQLCFELAFELIKSTTIDRDKMCAQMTGSFLRSLVTLLRSADARIPNYAKVLLHAVFERFVPLRKELQKYVIELCLEYIYNDLEDDDGDIKSEAGLLQHGIVEALELMSSMILGLRTPVKKRYCALFRNVIMPLHKVRRVAEFHDTLQACTTRFVIKDPKSLTVAIGYLLKFWPHCSPTKALLFIQELDTLIAMSVTFPEKTADVWLPVIKSEEYSSVLRRALKHVIDLMASSNREVAERSVAFWEESHIVKLTDTHKSELYPRLYPALREVSYSHWVAAVRMAARKVVNSIQMRDYELVSSLKTTSSLGAHKSVHFSDAVLDEIKLDDDSSDFDSDSDSDDDFEQKRKGLVVRPGITGAVEPSEKRSPEHVAKWQLLQSKALSIAKANGWLEPC